MPRGTKHSYGDKQKRIASKQQQRTKPKGRTTKTANRTGGALGNKRTGGGKRASK